MSLHERVWYDSIKPERGPLEPTSVSRSDKGGSEEKMKTENFEMWGPSALASVLFVMCGHGHFSYNSTALI